MDVTGEFKKLELELVRCSLVSELPMAGQFSVLRVRNRVCWFEDVVGL